MRQESASRRDLEARSKAPMLQDGPAPTVAVRTREIRRSCKARGRPEDERTLAIARRATTPRQAAKRRGRINDAIERRLRSRVADELARAPHDQQEIAQDRRKLLDEIKAKPTAQDSCWDELRVYREIQIELLRQRTLAELGIEGLRPEPRAGDRSEGRGAIEGTATRDRGRCGRRWTSCARSDEK